MRKNKLISSIVLCVIVICSFSSCVNPRLKQPIGVWKSESPYMIIDFSIGPNDVDNMTCVVMIDDEEYTFQDANMLLPHPSQRIMFGKYVYNEEVSEVISQTQYDWNNELTLSYSFSFDSLTVTVEESIFAEFPVGSKFKLFPEEKINLLIIRKKIYDVTGSC